MMIDNDLEESARKPGSFIFRQSPKLDRSDPKIPIQDYFRDNLGIWASRKFSSNTWLPLSNQSETRQLIRSKNGGVEISTEPLLSESLKIWFGREGKTLFQIQKNFISVKLVEQ